jgi:hypothetical protein
MSSKLCRFSNIFHQAVLCWKQLAKITISIHSILKTTCKAHNTKQFFIWKTTTKSHDTKQFSSKNKQILWNQAILYWKQLAKLTTHQAILYLITTCNAHNTKQFSIWKKPAKLTTPSSPPLKTACKAHNKWAQNSEPFLGSHKTTTPYNCPHKDNAPSQKSIKLLQ